MLCYVNARNCACMSVVDPGGGGAGGPGGPGVKKIFILLVVLYTW